MFKIPFFISFLISFFVCLVFIKIFPKTHWGKDETKGVQKIHNQAVPRIGGIGVFLGVFITILIFYFTTSADVVDKYLFSNSNNYINLIGKIPIYIIVLISSIPIVIFGSLEDFTRNISPRKRLLACLTSAFLAYFFLNLGVEKVDFYGFNGITYILSLSPIIVAITTILFISGVTNAFNIIDASNGLVAFLAIIVSLAMAYVSYIVGDYLVLYMAMILIASVLGFFVFNFPAGLIFLGDGGAYFIGFWLAELGLLLVFRNPEVSFWFYICLLSLPIVEMLFSIYRRKFVKRKSPTKPDSMHLHHLVLRRLVILNKSENDKHKPSLRNSFTSVCFWVIILLIVVLASIWWHSENITLFLFLVFGVLYTWFYWSIVLFKTPKFLIFRGRANFLYKWIKKVKKIDF